MCVARELKVHKEGDILFQKLPEQYKNKVEKILNYHSFYLANEEIQQKKQWGKI